MNILRLFPKKQRETLQKTKSQETVTPINLGLTNHGLESRPDLIQDKEVYSITDKDDKNLVHFFKAHGKTTQYFDPDIVGHGHPSYSTTTYSNHKYVGSVQLPIGWIYDHFNNCIGSACGEWLDFNKLFDGEIS